MRRVLAPALIVASIAVLPAAASAASPPPGATAQCRDGTYSYSTRHSGTCSHHGGVRSWLDGSGSTGGGTTQKSSSTPAPVEVGKTVLLKRRTRTSGCTLAALPDRRCSPGAYYSKLTKRVICSSSFRTSSVRHVPESEKFAVEREYGLVAKHYGQTLEIDHIVSLELGGSNDIANLYPEKAVLPGHAPGFRVKDKLENKLHALVCAGQMTLRAARQQVASNWERLFKKVYGVAPTG